MIKSLKQGPDSVQRVQDMISNFQEQLFPQRDIKPESDESSNDDYEFTVDSIVMHRDVKKLDSNGQQIFYREYKIRWKGFGPDDDTWEKQSDMANDIPQIVHAYESITKRILESRSTSKKI